MAEMLVRTIDKVNSESVYLDVQCTKRGDVIALCEDGHEWSKAEQTAPYWTIVKAPGVKVADLTAYLTPEPGDPQKDRMLQRRAFFFNLDAYAAAGKPDCDAGFCQAMKCPRPKRADPNVFEDGSEDVL